jgi:hypothetical protein
MKEYSRRGGQQKNNMNTIVNGGREELSNEMRWERIWYKEGRWMAKAGVLKLITAAQSLVGEKERVRYQRKQMPLV